MIDISKHSFLKYLLFGSLYFSEGIELSLATVIIPIYLHVEQGISLPMTTFIAGMVMIPWILKFIWGGIVDYFIRFGRKRFILLGGLLGVASFFTLVFIDPVAAIVPFVFFLFLSHVGVGFLDVSADAWAIEMSREEERGKINGAMFAGLFVGMAVGAAFLSSIAQLFGYSIAFLTTGVIVFFIILFPLAIKEVKIVKKRQKIGSLLVGEFKKKTTQFIAVFAPLLLISVGLLTFAVPLYMSTSLQLDVSQIGLIASIFPISMVVGALIGGVMSDRWGRKNPLYVFIVGSTIFTASLIFANTWLILAVIYGVIGFLRGGYAVGVNAMFMDITNPKIGATQFSILTSLANVGELSAGMVGGTLIALIGFSRVFLYSGWVFGPALLILYFIKLKTHIRKG